MPTSNSDPSLTAASTPPKISALLNSGTPVVLDGALATYLETLGADISGALWSAQILISNPDLIYRTHLDYYRTGANVAITSSYQASVPGLAKALGGTSAAEAKALIKKSVGLAKRARDDYLASLTAEERDRKRERLFVAGSVGPYGAFLADGSEYRGDYTLGPETMKDFHRGRIAALVEAGVDVLACETIPSFSETTALLDLLRTEFSGVEAWFSFTLRNEEHISDGTPLSDIAKVLDGHENVVSVGFNCVPESLVLGALKELGKCTSKPLIVYPNSGEEWDATKRAWKGARSEGSHLAFTTSAYWNEGARLIGGCCRTTPEDIAVISQTLLSISR